MTPALAMDELRGYWGYWAFSLAKVVSERLREHANGLPAQEAHKAGKPLPLARQTLKSVSRRPRPGNGPIPLRYQPPGARIPVGNQHPNHLRVENPQGWKHFNCFDLPPGTGSRG